MNVIIIKLPDTEKSHIEILNALVPIFSAEKFSSRVRLF